MRGTQQKLNEAIVMLEQAKEASNDYTVFIANLNAFVSAARSVTLVMQKEFHSIDGFEHWYEDKQQDMKQHEEFEFFKNLRVDTVHVRPFNTTSRYTTVFPGGLTVAGGTTIEVPIGRLDDRGNLVVSDQEPVMIDGRPVQGVQHLTSRSYQFTDRPNEDAIALCEQYLQKLHSLVTECHRVFQTGA